MFRKVFSAYNSDLQLDLSLASIVSSHAVVCLLRPPDLLTCSCAIHPCPSGWYPPFFGSVLPHDYGDLVADVVSEI